MKKSTIAVIILTLVVLGVGGFALANKSKPAATDTSTNTIDTSSQTTTQETTTPAEASTANVITYSNSGFSPSSITVKSGDTITIKNTSSHTLDFDSDPHPVHTDDRELNIGTVKAGETKTATLTTKGTWGYHNHLNSSETGTIVVQ